MSCLNASTRGAAIASEDKQCAVDADTEACLDFSATGGPLPACSSHAAGQLEDVPDAHLRSMTTEAAPAVPEMAGDSLTSLPATTYAGGHHVDKDQQEMTAPSHIPTSAIVDAILDRPNTIATTALHCATLAGHVQTGPPGPTIEARGSHPGSEEQEQKSCSPSPQASLQEAHPCQDGMRPGASYPALDSKAEEFTPTLQHVQDVPQVQYYYYDDDYDDDYDSD